MTKIKDKDLPVDLWAAIRKIWSPGAEGVIYQDGDRYIMETTFQHVEFSPEGKSFRMRVWGVRMDFTDTPAIDRVI